MKKVWSWATRLQQLCRADSKEELKACLPIFCFSNPGLLKLSPLRGSLSFSGILKQMKRFAFIWGRFIAENLQLQFIMFFNNYSKFIICNWKQKLTCTVLQTLKLSLCHFSLLLICMTWVLKICMYVHVCIYASMSLRAVELFSLFSCQLH